jgi:hypothetical protein
MHAGQVPSELVSGKLIGSIAKLRVAELATTVDTKFSHRAAS